MKRIFVLYTGGTIGMTQSEHGLRPDTQIVHTALAPYASSLHLDWHVCEPLIDSSAVSPQHWAEWLEIVQQKLSQYDGVLVLHGTDTLAYTANLFALALGKLDKPLILTGSQKPFGTDDSDAPKNLLTAVNALLRDDVREVLLAFNGDLFRAVGSSKVSTETDAGFANAHFGVWNDESVAPSIASQQSSLHLNRAFNPNIRVLPLLLIPAHSVQAATHALNTFDADAAILLSYGHGNAPNDSDLLAAIAQFTQQGKLLLNISQVQQGCAAAVYAQGSALRQSGAIQGGKCNLETATALLMLAAHNRWTAQEVELVLRDWQLL